MLASGNDWTANFWHEDSNPDAPRKRWHTSKPVVVWAGDADGSIPVGYITDGRNGLRMAETAPNFTGYGEPELKALDLDCYDKRVLEVELVTGRRFVCRLNPESGSFDFISFQLRDHPDTSVDVRPEAIISITVDWTQDELRDTDPAVEGPR